MQHIEEREVTFTLKMVDRGEFASDHPRHVEVTFSSEPDKKDREEIVQNFRRFLVACGYPGDYTMESRHCKNSLTMGTMGDRDD